MRRKVAHGAGYAGIGLGVLIAGLLLIAYYVAIVVIVVAAAFWLLKEVF